MSNNSTAPARPHFRCDIGRATHRNTMPDWRDAGVAAIVAAGAGLGFSLLHTSSWLPGACERVAMGQAMSVAGKAAAGKAAAVAAAVATGRECAAMSAAPVFLGLRGWQWLNLSAFAVGMGPPEKIIF